MSEEKVSVISPVGSETIAAHHSEPRPDTLNGKTIAEMWNGDFKGDFTFPIIRGLLMERYQGVQFVHNTEFPYSTIRGTPEHQREIDAEMIALAKEKGCDAVIAVKNRRIQLTASFGASGRLKLNILLAFRPRILARVLSEIPDMVRSMASAEWGQVPSWCG